MRPLDVPTSRTTPFFTTYCCQTYLAKPYYSQCRITAYRRKLLKIRALATNCSVPSDTVSVNSETMVVKSVAAHHKSPPLTAKLIQPIMGKVSGLLLKPCILKYPLFHAMLKSLQKALLYRIDQFTVNAMKKVELRGRTTPARSFENSGSIQDIISLLCVDEMSELDTLVFFKFDREICELPDFDFLAVTDEIIFPSEENGDDRATCTAFRKLFFNKSRSYIRHNFLSKLQCTCRIQLITWDTGNHGLLYFAIKLPWEEKDQNRVLAASALMRVYNQIPKFSSRKTLNFLRNQANLLLCGKKILAATKDKNQLKFV